MHSRRWLTLCMLALSLDGLPALASAQPENPPPPAAGEQQAGDAANERDLARRFLSERLKRIEAQQQAIRESLEMLDRGEPLDQVRAHARGPAGERLDRFREGDRGPGGRRDDRGPRDGSRRGGPDGPDPFGRPEHDGPRPPREGGEGHEGPEPVSLSPEDRKMIIDMLKEHRPGLAERLERLRESEPQEFDAMIRRNTPHFLRMVADKRRDPEMFQARRDLVESEFAARRLARQIRESGQPATPEQNAQLRAAVERQVDARLQFETRSVARMRTDLEKAEQRQRKLNEERQTLIDESVRDLIEGRAPDRHADPDRPPPPPDDRH